MSATSAPQIPPRPSRSPHPPRSGPSSLPQAPRRPPSKDPNRSVSPNNHLTSPLLDPPSSSGLGRSISNDSSSLSLPGRPPSVTLPSVGQEGNEYADIDYEDTNKASAPTDVAEEAHTNNILGDLKLHAPKPSLPRASAKAQVKTVTRTDDQQAAAHGFGKTGASTHEEMDSVGRSPTLRAPSVLESVSLSSPPSSRIQSVAPAEDDQGSAEIGLRVPINPDAGEVQAPSPSPASAMADHQSPGKKRFHTRTMSGREVSLPPGSYGLHGHGVQTHDRFDKDWYAKHPDQLVHEETIGHGHYASTGSGRGEWAMSSDDLNKIVRGTANRGAGFGTNEGLVSIPDEQIGYMASDQYSSRGKSPSQSGGYLHKLHSNTSQPAIESPLHKTSFPDNAPEEGDFVKSSGSVAGNSEAVESDTEEDVIHVDRPARHYNKVTGGRETMNEAADLGPQGGNTANQGGFLDETGYGVPILASDEVAKDTGVEFMQPAISPKQGRRDSHHYVGDDDDDDDGSDNTAPVSRPPSRPTSVHAVNASLSRFSSRYEDREEMHTSLEDVEEYEPLFPDDDDDQQSALNPAERFKLRSDTVRHRFPSQDIWEDTPSSAMHVTTVATLDAAAQKDSANSKPVSKTFEDPSVESARKGEADEAERARLIPKGERLAKSKFAPHLRDDMSARPGMQQRFPSRDIWEDTPDSTRLVTTVAPPSELREEPQSPPDKKAATKPAIPSRPINRSKLGENSSRPSVPVPDAFSELRAPDRPKKELSAAASADADPSDGAAQQSRTGEKTVSPAEGKQGPSIPDRPKPQVPVRPAKKDSLEPLTKTFSGGSSGKKDDITSPPLPKTKPTIPARHDGNKPNLPASFMSDLNQRLQLGPRPQVKEPDPKPGPEPGAEKDRAPLSDARKGRTRGPQRRAPGKSVVNSVEKGTTLSPRLDVSSVRSLWSISEVGTLVVDGLGAHSPQGADSVPQILTEDIDRPLTEAPKSMAPIGLAKNIAGDSTDPRPMYSKIPTPGTEKDNLLSKSASPLRSESREQLPVSSGGTGTSSEDDLGVMETEVPISEARTTASGDGVGESVLAADAGAEPMSLDELPDGGVDKS